MTPQLAVWQIGGDPEPAATPPEHVEDAPDDLPSSWWDADPDPTVQAVTTALLAPTRLPPKPWQRSHCCDCGEALPPGSLARCPACVAQSIARSA